MISSASIDVASLKVHDIRQLGIIDIGESDEPVTVVCSRYEEKEKKSL